MGRFVLEEIGEALRCFLLQQCGLLPLDAPETAAGSFLPADVIYNPL